ncbi:MAG: hypothetical protein CMI02_04075 [Oceanospirillaceae bacterium]|nr:hypothetical protein [Oceanospirillaceae bacterium]MBT11195.1 hypothetical protein [Oceanospirillaceae bacterium]
MADISTGSEVTQFSVSLNLVKAEISNALDQAASQLDVYSEQADPDSLRAFLEEIQQIRGTFKMLDFRAGERLCEELAETGRTARSQAVNESVLNAFTQAVVFLKRYVEFVAAGNSVAPSLLIPTINVVRRVRGDKPLPEAYFFLVNLRPKLQAPAPMQESTPFPYRRARQLYQLGLLGLIRGHGRRGPVQVMQRAVKRFEQASRGGASWLFWHVVEGALDALSQSAFDMTPQRISLLGALDRQVRRIQESEGQAFNEKLPDWLLKEFVYLVALAEPETEQLRTLQREFHVENEARETGLTLSRSRLSGPDQSALQSLADALQDELQSVKDQLDLIERTDISDNSVEDLSQSLSRIGDTLQIANEQEGAERSQRLVERLKSGGQEALTRDVAFIADEIIHLEQAIRSLTQEGLDQNSLVDPVSLNEARIAVLSESMTALTMIKRAVGAYIDSNGDKLHIRNVGKSIVDVAGAMMFLERPDVHDMLMELNKFLQRNVLESEIAPKDSQMEAMADALTAIEYFLDSLVGQTAGADEAIQLARESLTHLRK